MFQSTPEALARPVPLREWLEAGPPAVSASPTLSLQTLGRVCDVNAFRCRTAWQEYAFLPDWPGCDDAPTFGWLGRRGSPNLRRPVGAGCDARNARTSATWRSWRRAG